MTKSQLLILLLIIALIFYYLNEEAKNNSANNRLKKPLAKPTSANASALNLPASQEKLLNQGWPTHFPSNQPTNFGLNPPHSQLVEPPKPPQEPEPTIKFPFDLSIPDNSLNLPVNLPGPQWIEADDHSLNETYRQHFLTLLSTLPLNHLTQSTFKTLQTPNKPLHEYFQALWNLKGLVNYSSSITQPLREWINLTTALKPPNTPTDYGWLTDDNLEFILTNHQPIQSALLKTNLFSLRTDLANIYNSFSRAKNNQPWDLPEFIQELNKTPYTLFPLRVSGNHWGLFILHNLTWLETQPTYQVYYTSSGGSSLEEEKSQLQPFINQICRETPINIIQPADRQSHGHECGVYLVFYLQEILETNKLVLNRTYSSSQCQQFRFEWKERIGEKWCQF